ncbi:MAG: 2-phospho-L-lactate transferase CofD family protein, partial [Halanaerobiales bacterium]
MEIKKWLYPGIGVKRWIFFVLISLILISAGISILINFQIIGELERKVIQLFSPILGYVPYGLDIIISSILIIAGLLGVNYSFRGALKRFYQLESHEFVSKLYEKKVLEKGPKVVALGGGTGLSNLLRGLKLYTSNITAIVTVADDG